MEKRELGKSGLMVSPISLGCWSFGGGDYWGAQAQSDVNNVVTGALDYGVNLFDTAEAYNDGASETSLREALGNRRNEAIIITKQFVNADKDDTVERLEASLRRLGTDYVDVFMIHWPVADQKAMERVFMRCMELRDAGKIRSLGVSNFGMEQMRFMRQCGYPCCVNELHYNVASRALEKDIRPVCLEHGIGIITYVSLQQGVLTGKYPTLDAIPPKQARYRHFSEARGKGLSAHGSEGADKEFADLLAVLQETSARLGLSMTDLCLAWALRQLGISSAIVGCRNLEQLELNLKSATVQIDDATNEALAKAGEALYHKLGYSPDYVKPLSKTRIC